MERIHHKYPHYAWVFNHTVNISMRNNGAYVFVLGRLQRVVSQENRN